MHFPITIQRYVQRACEKIVKFHGNWCSQMKDEKKIVFIQIPWNGNWNGNEMLGNIFLSSINSFYSSRKSFEYTEKYRNWSRKILSLRMNYFQNFFPRNELTHFSLEMVFTSSSRYPICEKNFLTLFQSQKVQSQAFNWFINPAEAVIDLSDNMGNFFFINIFKRTHCKVCWQRVVRLLKE